MATVGVPITNLMKIRTGSGTPVALACLTSTDFDVSADTRDTSCFDTDKYGSVLPSKVSAKLSGAGLWAFDAAAGANALLIHTAIKAGTAISWEYGSGVTGDPKFSGSGYFTSFKSSASGNFDNLTYSFDLMVTGDWTAGTYS